MAEASTKVLVLGGARSGKSAYAQAQAEASGRDRVYIATATAGDGEMAARIAAHVAARGAAWRTIEAPDDLAGALRATARPGALVLVDCLTLWLSNRMLAGDDVEAACRRLEEAVVQAAAPVLLVSNEVGDGLVPDTALGRRFRDAQGRLNQRIAAICDKVVLVTAGLPRLLKPTPTIDLAL